MMHLILVVCLMAAQQMVVDAQAPVCSNPPCSIDQACFYDYTYMQPTCGTAASLPCSDAQLGPGVACVVPDVCIVDPSIGYYLNCAAAPAPTPIPPTTTPAPVVPTVVTTDSSDSSDSSDNSQDGDNNNENNGNKGNNGKQSAKSNNIAKAKAAAIAALVAALVKGKAMLTKFG